MKNHVIMNRSKDLGGWRGRGDDTLILFGREPILEIANDVKTVCPLSKRHKVVIKCSTISQCTLMKIPVYYTKCEPGKHSKKSKQN